jgi:hypothetical protein
MAGKTKTGAEVFDPQGKSLFYLRADAEFSHQVWAVPDLF